MLDKEKFVASYLNMSSNVGFDDILEKVLENPSKFNFVKVLDRYTDSKCDTFIVFSFDDKIYKVEYWVDSYGDTTYYDPVEVQRKTKEVVYYE